MPRSEGAAGRLRAEQHIPTNYSHFKGMEGSLRQARDDWKGDTTNMSGDGHLNDRHHVCMTTLRSLHLRRLGELGLGAVARHVGSALAAGALSVPATGNGDQYLGCLRWWCFRAAMCLTCSTGMISYAVALTILFSLTFSSAVPVTDHVRNVAVYAHAGGRVGDHAGVRAYV